MNRADIPAFPRPTSTGPNGHFMPQDGLTLREYLAGQALIGVMALNSGRKAGLLDYQLIADHAVAMADLTLIALDRVTHEDNAARILRSSADPFTRDEDRGQTQEDEKDTAAETKPEQAPLSPWQEAPADDTPQTGETPESSKDGQKDPAAKKPEDAKPAAAAAAAKTDAKKTVKAKA